MKHLPELIWTAIGLFALAFACWLLARELRGLSLADVEAGLRAITVPRLAFAALSTLVAYGALAWYDQIGLAHLGHRLGWGFVGLVSFTTYALAHNVGASVLSGAVVRYRAYSTRGLGVQEVALLVAFCSFTFFLGSVTVGGFALILEPSLVERIAPLPVWSGQLVGLALLSILALFVIGSLRHFAPRKLWGFSLVYPRPPVAAKQILAGPLELLGATGIIYFALPPEANPGFIAVAGIFVASFSIALVSHAPGGIGVLEFAFLKAMPEVPRADLIAALLVFRLFYLLAPFVFAIVVAALFERHRIARLFRSAET